MNQESNKESENTAEEEKETTAKAIRKAQRLLALQARRPETNQIQPGGFTREQEK